MFSASEAFSNVIMPNNITLEEGTIRGRNFIAVDGLTEDLGAAEVNGPEGNKGQNIWDGTYTVELDRGIGLDSVYHITDFGFAAQSQRCLNWGDRVVIAWMNRLNVQIPVILDGCTIDTYNKQLFSKSHLLDSGERIIRSAMANSPGALGDYPFADNQYDKSSQSESTLNEDTGRIIQYPGGETFFDKFGRIVSLSRNPEHEFLTTMGRIDSGQNDVSDLTTISEQDSYYDDVQSDESNLANQEEPFAPQALNLVQYQQRVKQFKIAGDKDPNRTVSRGLLPRFDKWKFVPVVIRKYSENSDGQTESGTTYSVKQDRAQTIIGPTETTYGYVNTITDSGDLKEFIPRHVNRRIVGDNLTFVGGNDDFKIKTTMLLSDGSVNTKNWVHREYLSDGTARLRINEDTSAGTATYDNKVSPDGTVETYIKAGGGSSSDYNFKLKVSPEGSVELDSKSNLDLKLTGNINVIVDGDANVTAGGTVSISGASVELGDNPNKQLCANLPNCLFTGAPLAVGNTKVRC